MGQNNFTFEDSVEREIKFVLVEDIKSDSNADTVTGCKVEVRIGNERVVSAETMNDALKQFDKWICNNLPRIAVKRYL